MTNDIPKKPKESAVEKNREKLQSALNAFAPRIEAWTKKYPERPLPILFDEEKGEIAWLNRKDRRRVEALLKKQPRKASV